MAMCNHVFEHVDEDYKAMTEFLRILKPGGWAIFQVPIDTTRDETYEDANIIDPKEREKHYWQHDHVRLYGNDYGKRLIKAGFEVEVNNFIEEIGAARAERYALPKGELLYICRKPL